jgi:hypothetical protein
MFSAQFDLPFFRMSACAHGIKPFDKLTKDQRVEIEKQMIVIINRWMARGLATTVDPAICIRIMPREKNLGIALIAFAPVAV